MKYLVLLAVLATLPLTACKTTVKGDDYEIQSSNGSHGNFCPPGQAKKGNC